MQQEKFSGQLIEEIKSRIDLTDFLGRYVNLNRNLKALCPFHPEKAPSFSVNPKKQYWHCFGCGAGGDIFTFIQLIEKLNFSDAVKLLAREAGVPLPQSKRFKGYIARRWQGKKKLLDNIEFCKRRLKQAEIKRMAELRLERKRLPPRERWDSWNAKDYLKEQIVDYKFDLLDVRMRKIEDGLDDNAREIRNG